MNDNNKDNIYKIDGKNYNKISEKSNNTNGNNNNNDTKNRTQ